MKGLAKVMEVTHGERHTSLQQADKLFSLFQALEDAGFVGRKCHRLHALEPHLADAVFIMQSISNPDKYGVGKENGMTKQGEANGDHNQKGAPAASGAKKK